MSALPGLQAGDYTVEDRSAPTTDNNMRQSNPSHTFWSVSVGHLTVDMFTGMGPVLLVFLSAHVLSMSNTQIGFAVSLYQLLGALSQPVFGIVGDRSGGRLLGAGGVAWTVTLLLSSLVIAQVTGSFYLMLIPYALAALGSGAFHPVGAMHVSEVNRGRAATNTGIFFLMGQIGLAIGPTLAGFLLDRFASHNNSLFTEALGPAYAGRLLEHGTTAPIISLGVLAIPGVVYMALSIPSLRAHLERRAASAAHLAAEAAGASRLQLSALALLAVVVALRSLINPAAAAFVPRLFQLKGWDATAYGFVTSAFWLGGGISGVIIGHMADRYDSRWLVAITLVLSAPALFLLTLVDGPVAIVTALAVGALSGGSHSLLVVQAQGLFPGRKGLASGAILGFMFSTGAIGSLLIGAMSDSIGLANAFHIVAGITVITGVLGLALPPDRQRARAITPARHETAAASAD